jgi:prepilin-type N-terminal cleavage/methylation domain-containing protein
MTGSKGFTLIEILIVLVIVGIAATITIPNLINSIEQTKAQEAKNNLLAISAAQEKYFEDHGSYYYGANPNANLSLSGVTGDPFSYSCSATGQNIPYNCTAGDNTDTLTLDPNANPPVSCAPNGCGIS